MATTFRLSWNRPISWAVLLGKPPGRVISDYPSHKYDEVEAVATHINSLDPEMECRTEVYRT